MHRILLYKTGETDRSLVPHIGDYEAWFARVLGPGYALEIHRAFDKPQHRIGGYDGMVITGSPRSLVEPEPWMDDAAAFVRGADDAGVPVLGVCFGHQLVGYAHGGRVRQNPNGWEVGTVDVELTDDGARDPLFAGVGRRLSVIQSHRDEVGVLGGTTRVLAAGAHTPHQAIAVGDHVRGVQFHPEMTASIIRRVIESRRAILGCNVDERIASANDCPDAERVLVNFVEQFVKKASTFSAAV